MKVLIISNNAEKINLVDSFMKAKGYDVIIYNWMLKAIDNIEEIRPDVIFLSSTEFPRHWKTLASFVQSGIGGDNIRLFLYEQEPLSEEEIKKAEALGIEACITSLDEDCLSTYFPSDESEMFTNRIIITSPVDGSLLSGSVIEFKNKKLLCNILSYGSDKLDKGMILEEVSVSFPNKIKFLSATVEDNDVDKGIITLAVQEYYEKN